MSKSYFPSSESKLYKLISKSVRGRIFTRSDRHSRDAVGECEGGSVIKYSYGRLFKDSLALASLIARIGADSFALVGGGAYEVALALMAASRLECKLSLSKDDRYPTGEPLPSLVISSTPPVDGAAHIDLSALPTAIAGERSSPSGPAVPFPTGDGFLLSFISERGTERYTEEALIFSASAFADMSALKAKDVTLCDGDPHSPHLLVCGILASALSGGCAIFLRSGESFDEHIRLSRPTRLLCGLPFAEMVLESLRRDDAPPLNLPVPFRGVPTLLPLGELTLLSRRRRLSMARLMRLGGELEQVTVSGLCPRQLSEGLADFGVVTASALSTSGCPFTALRAHSERRSGWTLPRGMLADICDVKKGGKGRLTISGKGLRLMCDEPIHHGCLPGKFRLDGWEGLSLVTDFHGYVLPNGNIFVEKQFFCENTIVI